MQRAPRVLLLSLTALAVGCATGRSATPRVASSPIPAKPAAGPSCGFLDGERDADCDPSLFLDRQVDRLVKGLESDPLWGALVSPELEAEGRMVVVANVVPSLDYLSREEEASEEVQALVTRVSKGLANRLFRRSLTLVRADGSRMQAVFQEGQLRGQSVNDYTEYLAQVGQPGGGASFFPGYEAVELKGRAARTGLLWLVSARTERNGAVTVEFRIKTFEMARSEDGKVLTVRGQLADRTGQLLGTIYTTWVDGRVARYEPVMPHTPDAERPAIVTLTEAESSAKSEEVEPPTEPSAPATATASDEVGEEPEVQVGPGTEVEPLDTPVLWITVARVGPTAAGARLVFGRDALPMGPSRFALVFINEHPEGFAYVFGPRLGRGAPAVPMASDASDRSAVAPAYQRAAVSVAMSSVFAVDPAPKPHVLVLRRNQPWSFEEQGRARWVCDREATYHLADLPPTRHEGEVAVGGWVRREMGELLGVDVSGPETVDAQRFLTIPLNRIPGEGSGDAMCIVLPFAPDTLEGDV